MLEDCIVRGLLVVAGLSRSSYSRVADVDLYTDVRGCSALSARISRSVLFLTI